MVARLTPEPRRPRAAPKNPPIMPAYERERARALELHALGLSYRGIAAALNIEGFRTVRGAEWNSATTWRLISPASPYYRPAPPEPTN